jgi:hypothetical protein
VSALPPVAAACAAHCPALLARYTQEGLHVTLSRSYDRQTGHVTVALDAPNVELPRAWCVARDHFISTGFYVASVDVHHLTLTGYYGRRIDQQEQSQ